VASGALALAMAMGSPQETGDKETRDNPVLGCISNSTAHNTQLRYSSWCDILLLINNLEDLRSYLDTPTAAVSNKECACCLLAADTQAQAGLFHNNTGIGSAYSRHQLCERHWTHIRGPNQFPVM
jgi:hypothetical protein